MILERIQKHLRAIFVLMLVFTQGLIFVYSKATGDEYKLQANFVEPLIGQNIEIGQELNLEAAISSTEDLSSAKVFFTVLSLDTLRELNFETQKQNNNYFSAASWDTSTWPSGLHQIFATAYIYKEDGSLDSSYQSEPGLIRLYENNVQMAAEVAQPTVGPVSFIEPVNNAILSGDSVNFVLEITEQVDVSYSTISIYPAGEVATENLIATLDVNYLGNDFWGINNVDISSYSNDQYTAIFEGAIINDTNSDDLQVPDSVPAISIAGSVIFTVQRTANPEIVAPELDILSPTANAEVGGPLNIKVALPEPLLADFDIYTKLGTSTSEGMALTRDLVQATSGFVTYSGQLDIVEENYPAGVYSLSFWTYVSNNGEQVRHSFSRTVSVNVVYGDDYAIYLDSPSGTTPVARDFILQLHTGFTANYINMLLTSQDGLFSKENNLDQSGDHWTWHAVLGDAWPAGLSTLSVVAGSGDQVVEHEFPIYIESLAAENIDPASVELSISNPGSLSGQASLRAQANYAGLDVEFFVIDTLTEEEVWRGLAGEVDQYYVAALDTRQLPNGNYEILAEADVQNTLIPSSNSFVVQIFNEYNQGDSEQEVIFTINDDYVVNSTGRIMTYFLTSSIPLGVVYNMELRDSDYNVISENEINYTSYAAMYNERWSTLEANNILQAEHADTPYAGKISITLSDASSSRFPDGKYYLKINILDNAQEVIATDEVSFSVLNGLVSGWQANRVDEPIVEEEAPQNEVENILENERVAVNRSALLIDPYYSCLEVGLTDQVACDRFRATIDRLDPACIEASIYSASACEDYLNRTQVDAECRDEGMLNVSDCQDYLLEKYAASVDCQLADKALCTQILRNNFLNRLVVGQKKQVVIGEVVEPLIGQNIKLFDLNQKLLQRGIKNDSLSLDSNADTKVFLAKSSKETVLENEDRLTILNQAVIIIDSDGDGLSDDLEAYYESDPLDTDTDDDGYTDAVEVTNGYNPLGEGELGKSRTYFDKIILSGSVLEQPKTLSKKADENFKVEDISATEEKVSLSGRAEANTWVLIYLYSDLPLVMSTKTDASGNWSYDIKHSLADGHHQVYVTVNDETGKIVKQSKPVSFLINQAQAVTAEDYFDTASAPDNVQNMVIYYILGGVLLVILALGVIMFIHSRKNRTPNIGPDNGQV
ncbi:hypothetical protein C4566_03610 [Candidatus Parcubacteria bacterium]|nr:MAG: hypothetical protein C4566_03610 [Candidatus Parcubacteria bacterium]